MWRVSSRRLERLIMASLFVLCLLICSCHDAKTEKSRTQNSLGTVCTITLFDNGTPELYDVLFSRLDEIESVFSKNLPDSELSKINASASIMDASGNLIQTEPDAVTVSAEMAVVLEKALYYAEKSEGSFNPAIGPLVECWGIGTDNARVPSESEIKELLPLCDYKLIFWDKDKRAVRLAKRGMRLDLGAIVKGYAADEVALLIRDSGIKSALVDLGGNIYAVGGKIVSSAGKKSNIKAEYSNKDTANGEEANWRIGVKNPLATSALAACLEGKDITVVTSGVYERVFYSNGKAYHHIIDTKTGYPAENGLLSSTIAALYPEKTSMDADALSTAVFVLGAEKGIALLESEGVAGFVIADDAHIITTFDLSSSNEQRFSRISFSVLDDYYSVEFNLN